MNKLLLIAVFLVQFIYSGSGQFWSQQVKLEASDKEIDDNHGISVAISGDYAIVGAFHEDYIDGTGGATDYNAGAAYIYRYNEITKEWSEEAKLVAADREWLDEFGVSVAIDGNYAVIGAVGKEAVRGAAYVFERSDAGIWVQVKKLTAPFSQANDRFAYAVAISGTTIVVGAHHEDEDEAEINTLQNAGSAYIYTRTTGAWEFAQKIVASDRDYNDSFGYSVGIHEDKIIVGAYKYDPDGIEIGGAYVFALDGGTWMQTRILKAANPYDQDRFGWSVDVHDSYYIVGAPYHNFDNMEGDDKNNTGAAYIYDASNSWAEDKIVANNRNGQDNLGEDVAIHGTRAVAGAPLQDYDLDGNPPYWGSGGAAFVFEKDGNGFWSQKQKLLTNDRFSGDKFGHSVDLDTRIIGGAPEDNSGNQASTGALYVFEIENLTSTKTEDISQQLNAYPNPTSGQVNIHLGNSYTEVTISARNILGQIIFRKNFTNTNSINMELLGIPGMYLITIHTSTGHSGSLSIIKN